MSGLARGAQWRRWGCEFRINLPLCCRVMWIPEGPPPCPPPFLGRCACKLRVELHLHKAIPARRPSGRRAGRGQGRECRAPWVNPRWAPGDPPSRGGATASPSRQHETPSPACGSPAPRQRHLGAPGAAGGGENASGGGSVWGSGAAGISHCRARSGPQTCKCLLSPEVCGAFVCQVSGASPPSPHASPPAGSAQPAWSCRQVLRVLAELPILLGHVGEGHAGCT